MLAGGDFMCDLDHQRSDEVGAALRAVSDIPASTTFIGLAKRFDDEVFGGVEGTMAELVGHGSRLCRWPAGRPTIDLDPTDVEV
jgi:hypothetical protein